MDKFLWSEWIWINNLVILSQDKLKKCIWKNWAIFKVRINIDDLKNYQRLILEWKAENPNMVNPQFWARMEQLTKKEEELMQQMLSQLTEEEQNEFEKYKNQKLELNNFTISIEDLKDNNFPENISDDFKNAILENKNTLLKKWYKYIEFDFFEQWLNWQEWDEDDDFKLKNS